MKKLLSALVIVLIGLTLTNCQPRIADLTMVSTRNIDKSADYKEIQRYVKGSDVALHSILLIFGPLETPDIEDALDKGIKKVEGGEFMKNVVIREQYLEFILFALRRFKVEGDVWGIPPKKDESVSKSVEKSVSAKIEFKSGDKVTFKNMGKLVEGTIIGVNQNTAVVKFNAMIGGEKNKEVEYEKLTKIE